jgi:hypothetical protein
MGYENKGLGIPSNEVSSGRYSNNDIKNPSQKGGVKLFGSGEIFGEYGKVLNLIFGDI